MPCRICALGSHPLSISFSMLKICKILAFSSKGPDEFCGSLMHFLPLHCVFFKWTRSPFMIPVEDVSLIYTGDCDDGSYVFKSFFPGSWYRCFPFFSCHPSSEALLWYSWGTTRSFHSSRPVEECPGFFKKLLFGFSFFPPRTIRKNHYAVLAWIVYTNRAPVPLKNKQTLLLLIS